MPSRAPQHKRALRAEVREQRRLLTPAQRDQAAHGIAAQLDALVDAHRAQCVSCFLSTSAEPGTQVFIRGAVVRGIRVLVPVTRTDGLLDWAAVKDPDAVAAGLYGIPEPTGDALTPQTVHEVDLMLIPAAAADRSGTRLGWGRGYFDRAIGSMPEHRPVYAVIYDSEVFDSLPREPHDQPVDGIVTPTRTIRLASARN